MIRTVLMLHVSPGRVEEVVEVYRRADILQYSLDHSEAIRSELSVAVNGSGAVMVTALWPSVDSYQGWLGNPWRASSGIELREILDGVEVGSGEVFEIRQSVTKD
jgi:hypothetical protein